MDDRDSIYHRNIQVIATEMFKVKNKLSPKITPDIFTRGTNNYNNLRNINHFETALARCV